MNELNEKGANWHEKSLLENGVYFCGQSLPTNIMAISGFRVENVKAIKIAECTDVPKVMIIAGPNGVGKSTLLHELQKRTGVTASGSTEVFYQGPHRALRRTQVSQRSLLGSSVTDFQSVLTGTGVPNFEGFNNPYPQRTPDNVDEAGSLIKHVLGLLENRKSTVQNQLLDKCRREGRDLRAANLPNIYAPLAELTKYLLPHLKFDRVEIRDRSDIRCVFKRTDDQGEMELDIDDLSSGEKSIIILFFPLLENEIEHLLNSILQLEEGSAAPATGSRDRVFIIDEPEVHLHPELQARIMVYIRDLSKKGNTQFIISTHSPTILDQAFDNELYLMLPPTNPPGNQIKKVASSLERLEGLKQIAGEAYLLATGRSIICIEGHKASRTPTDLRLLEMLYPRATAYTFLPTNSKGQVIDLVNRLRDFLPESVFKLHIAGITDRDRSVVSASGVFPLPVCMIENLLLADLEKMHQYLVSIGVTTFANANALKTELIRLAMSLKQEEIDMRVTGNMKSKTIRFKGGTIADLKSNFESELHDLKAQLADEAALQQKIDKATTDTEQIITDGKILEAFRGKRIIDLFYHAHVQAMGKSESEFAYELAAYIAKGEKIFELLDPLFNQIAASR